MYKNYNIIFNLTIFKKIIYLKFFHLIELDKWILKKMIIRNKIEIFILYFKINIEGNKKLKKKLKEDSFIIVNYMKKNY